MSSTITVALKFYRVANFNHLSEDSKIVSIYSIAELRFNYIQENNQLLTSPP